MKLNYGTIIIILLIIAAVLAGVTLVAVDQLSAITTDKIILMNVFTSGLLQHLLTRMHLLSAGVFIVLLILGVLWGTVLVFQRQLFVQSVKGPAADQRQQSRNIQQQYEIFNILTDSSPDLIFYKDIAGIYLGCNRAFEEFVNMTEEMIVGKTDWDLFSQKDAEFFRENDQQMLSQGEARHNEEWISYSDGRRVLLDTLKTPFFDKSGDIIGILGVSRDITERENAQQELKRAAAIKSEFTSMVSHELRTPLAVVIEAVKIVADGSCGSVNEEQQEYLTVAERNVERLGRLINDVLDVQKLESGMMEFDLKEHDINALIVATLDSMRPVADHKGLTLTADLAPDMPLIKFDNDKITQVITNLLNNSIKFTESGGITVTTEKGNNYIKIAVTDTGLGIKKEDMSKLFGKFEQIFKEEGKRPEGTGLGLAICKEIINRHSGTIWANSEFGKGSIFSIVLPVVERRGKGVEKNSGH